MKFEKCYKHTDTRKKWNDIEIIVYRSKNNDKSLFWTFDDLDYFPFQIEKRQFPKFFSLVMRWSRTRSCDQVFKTKHARTRHLASEHGISATKPFQCLHKGCKCGQFQTNAHLQAHLKRSIRSEGINASVDSLKIPIVVCIV